MSLFIASTLVIESLGGLWELIIWCGISFLLVFVVNAAAAVAAVDVDVASSIHTIHTKMRAYLLATSPAIEPFRSICL